MADSFGGISQLTFPAVDEKPDPLHAIARRLFPLVRSRPNWWREAVRRWADDPPLHGDDGVLPVPFPETLTPDERLAILAAIHDAYATEVARVDPWPSRVLPPLESADAIPGEYQLAIRYDILVRNRVPKLRQDWDMHEAAIELFFAEAIDAVGSVPKGESERRRPGRKKADYRTQQREAKLAADWKRAKESGEYKPDFAKQKGLTLKDLDALLARVRMRNSTAKE